MAAKLSPFLDSKEIFVEGELTGTKGFYDMPIALRLFGTSDPAASGDLKQQLKDARLPVDGFIHEERERKQRERADQKQRELQRKKALKDAAQNATGVYRQADGHRQFERIDNNQFANITVPNGDSSYTDPSMDTIMESAVEFNPRELGNVVNKYGATEETLSKLPFAQQPTNMLTKLLPFQLQGLAWMLDRENPQLPEVKSSDTTQL